MSLHGTCSEERRPQPHASAGAGPAAAVGKPTVLVYRSDMLPLSETFIKEQMTAYSRWHGLLTGRRLLGELDLDGLEVALLNNRSGTTFRARSWLGFAPELKILRKARPRLLHVHFGPEAVAAAPLARALAVPMLVTLHGYDITIRRDWWEGGGGGAQMRRYPAALLKLARRQDVHFVAVSDALRARALAYGIAPKKITTCYIGVDAAKFAPGPTPMTARPTRVLFVGRLVEKKGCDILLRAMALVRRRLPAAEVAIAGDGPLRPELEQLSRNLDIQARFYGALAPRQVKAALDEARVFCLPSVQAANGDAEGFGLALLEAQAAGLPAVSSALGGAREGILHGETGYQFEEKDLEMLSSHLCSLLADPHKAASMGRAARTFVMSRFNIESCTAALEQVYNRLAGIPA